MTPSRRLALAVLFILVWIGCVPVKPDTTQPTTHGQNNPDTKPGSSLAFQLVIGGQLNGYIEPCECTEGMLGGMARRASFIQHVTRQSSVPVLNIDTGDVVDGFTRQAFLKARTSFNALSRMGTVAIGLGTKDFQIGPNQLQDLLNEQPGLPIVTSNMVETDDPTRTFGHDMVPVSLNENRTLHILSLIEPDRRLEIENLTDGAWTITDPNKVLDRLHPKGPYVVIVHGERAEFEPIMKGRNPLVVIYTHGTEETPSFGKNGTTPWIQIGLKGLRLVRLPVHLKKGTYQAGTPVIVPMTDKIPDQPDVASLIIEYRRILQAEGLVDKLIRETPKTGGRYVGSASCRSCHAKPFRIWEQTPHASAMSPLERKEAQGDPECLQCHVVGLHYESGYRTGDSPTYLGAVGCESCHGPASNHVEGNKSGYGQTDRNDCITCHDPHNSPKFDFDTYWPKIRH